MQKQLYTFLFLLFISMVGKCQKTDHVIVSGDLKFANSGKRILNITYRKIGHGYQFDSTVVIDGRFKFEKELVEPIVAILSLKNQPNDTSRRGTFNYISLFVLPGDVRLLADKNFMTAKVTGSGAVANADYQD